MLLVRNFASLDTIRRRFGSFPAALHAAGLRDHHRKFSHRRQQYDNDDLLAMLRRVANDLDRVPRCRDLLAIDGAPSPATFANRFGSWRHAVALAVGCANFS